MPNSIDVRPARAEDKAGVLAFCRTTFSWGDYIPEVWDDWLAFAGGQLFVATVAEQLAGVVHVALLEHNVAWMEGMRVNPDYRRQGVARVLNARAVEFARERGCEAAQLVTSTKNVAAQAMLEASNYRRAVRFNEWQTEPQAGDFSMWRVATANDIDNILTSWNASDIHAVSRQVIPTRHWHWTPISKARLYKHLQATEVRVTQNGFAFLPAFDERDWNGLSIYLLSGTLAEMTAMAFAARAEAAYRGYAHVEAFLVDHASLNTALENARFKTESGVFLYEQEL